MWLVQVLSRGGRGSVPGVIPCVRLSQPSNFAAMRLARMSAHIEVLELDVAITDRNTRQQHS